MPLQSRLTRAKPEGAAAPAAATQEDVSPRRRSAPVEAPPEDDQPPFALTAPDATEEAASDAAASPSAETDPVADDETPVTEAPPAQTAAPTPAKERRKPGPKPKVVLEGDDMSTDPATIKSLLLAVEHEVKELRKQHDEAVQPLVDRYKLLSGRYAELISGRL